jgi:exodeoxyribonuclease V alpha subunit
LNKEQLEAIRNALDNKISIISGYAGTGKTTIIKTLLKIFKDNDVSSNLTYTLL